MAQNFRVRLADGSVIGPLDKAALRSWFEGGLITSDTPASYDDSSRWTTLRQVVDMTGWARPSSGSARPRSQPARARTPAPGAASRAATPAPRSRPAGVLPFGLNPRLVFGAAGLVALVGLGWLASTWFARPASKFELSSERRLEAANLDLAIDLPAAWSLVAEGAPEPLAPPGAYARLVTAAGVQAYLSSNAHTPGSAPTATLDSALRGFRGLQPGFTPGERQQVRIAERDFWSCEGQRSGAAGGWARVVAWRNGFRDFSLVAWAPSPRAGAQVETLLAAVTHPGGTGQRAEQALAKAVQELPQLDHATIELLMQRSEAQVLEPPDLLRRSYEHLGRGLAKLTPAERSDLMAVHGALYGGLSARDRHRLASFVDRARESKPLAPGEDQAALGLLRSAVARLPAQRRARLQALFAKAIAAAG